MCKPPPAACPVRCPIIGEAQRVKLRQGRVVVFCANNADAHNSRIPNFFKGSTTGVPSAKTRNTCVRSRIQHP